ncbi:MAG: glucoamylase family protein [Verrucomicrobiota bacterium]
MSHPFPQQKKSDAPAGHPYRQGFLALLAFASLLVSAAVATPVVGAATFAVEARPRMLRVDLSWQPQGEKLSYEVQRATSAQGPWTTLPNPTPEFRRFTDFTGKAGQHFFYRVRALKSGKAAVPAGDWSAPAEATTLPFDRDKLVEDVQEAGVRFYVEQAHPVSGLAPEGTPGWVTATGEPLTAIGASGMGMANLVVGVERGFIPRKEGFALALRMWRFLDTKAEKQMGAFGHWIDGQTGANKKFADTTAADLVETAFLIQGGILLREYFNGDTPEEKELRDIVNRLSAGVQWDQFMVEAKTGPIMMWHGPSENGPAKVTIRGFHEAMMPYILGIGSDTHPINPQSFYTGWMDPQRGLGQQREDFGIKHSLGRGIGWPLFFAHYSHIGFDPKQISYDGKTYFEHFVDACRIQQLYAKSRAAEFKGYETLWGEAASLNPKGYRANSPGPNDDGTIATTAALSSMPYLPEAVLPCMESMYLNYGGKLWGAYGFYNAINPTQDWVGQKYIGIELGPIAPMIENYRSGLLWKLFMQAPETRRARQRIEAGKR